MVFKRTFLLFMGIELMVIFSGCMEDEPQVWAPKNNELQIGEYIELNDDLFSEFSELVERTGFIHLLMARGPYTLFLPTNEAMLNYYSFKGLNSIDELSIEEMEKLVRTHLFGYLLPTEAIRLGSLPDTNALGDFISSEFLGSDIIIDKYSKIIKRDILNANGYVHIIDKTIDPITRNIFEVISEDQSYSIFTEGLAASGLDESLQAISIRFGNMMARIWFTIFAVPNDVFNEHSIYNVDDLIARYDDSNGAITDPENGFFKYMEYHCLEGTYYLSAIVEGAYPTISRENQVYIRVDTAYKINYLAEDSSYTNFIIEQANISAKNGVIHPVDDLLPAIEPIPVPIIFQVTDYPDVRSQDCYKKYIKNFMDGKNSFAKIKWQGDYLQYYYKESQKYIDHDQLKMSQGFWWLEITVPKIPKGKYKLSVYTKTGSNRGNMITYVDGVKNDLILECRSQSGSYETLEIGEVDWESTSEHTIKFTTIVPGQINLDYFLFEPIL